MVRIRWRDPGKRRVSYAGFRFDEKGVSLKAWPKANCLRLKRFFLLNQHRMWFETVEDAPPEVTIPSASERIEDGGGAEAAPPPPPSAESVVEVAVDEDQQQRKRGRGRYPKVRSGDAEKHGPRDGRVGKANSVSDQGKHAEGSDEEPAP